ncbi:hypothetical protein [Falsiroseomonas sp.]|uniref:hypothetical protein n=1 Tax=Falsiroseomonas sp. TaxID=2870721 RepID=UPI0027213B55|nr:hypothetical protein [Falsiroseomonas sp.]MDO9500264.1 hypothetical protein [Falsiroseomonas sp.]
MTGPDAPRIGPEEALVAGAWLGPVLAMLAGLALLALLGVQGEFLTLLIVVALSLLAGAPAAVLAARRGLVGWPLGLATGCAGLSAFALFHGLDGLPVAQALAAALAGAALALLWVGLGVAAGFGLSPVPGLAMGALAGVVLAWLIGGVAGAFGGLALGAALAGFLAAMPAATVPVRLRPCEARALAMQALAGLALALAVLAGPFSAYLLDGPVMVVTLALLAALPGLLLLAASRGVAPLALATGLLGLQALAVALGLVVGGAPAAAGWVPAEALGDYRLALLGAGFLPAFAALVAALLGRQVLGAVLAALLLAVLSAVLGPLLGLVQPGLGPFGALAAPVLATGFAFWLLARGEA